MDCLRETTGHPASSKQPRTRATMSTPSYQKASQWPQPTENQRRGTTAVKDDVKPVQSRSTGLTLLAIPANTDENERSEGN
jgi:hypothetical protein